MKTTHVLGIVAALLAAAAAVAGSAHRTTAVNVDELAGQIEREDDHVTAIELAQWIKDRKAGLRVIDVRSDSEFAEMHIPTAERWPLDSLSALKPISGETLVLYSEGGAHAAQGWVLLRALGHRNVYFLRGGLLDWLDDVISPTLPATPDSASVRTAALSRYFGGTPHVSFSSSSTPAQTSTPGRNDSTTAHAAVARLRRRGC